MAQFKIGNISVGGFSDSIFVIAEIGQNHQGSLDIAKQLILEAKKIGCTCVKFQKSCLNSKFTQNALQRPYNGTNSWGRTYGEHKKFLEFSIQQFKELQLFAFETNILFTASAMDETSFEELLQLDLPFIKIGSGDANNFRLIERAAQQSVPLVISTGMQEMWTIDKIVSIMEKYNKKNYCLMHCVSAYPTKPADINLQVITLLKFKYPNVLIGYSGHEEGITISLSAILLGAKLIERHFTLDKMQKGSDHVCSLLPSEFTKLNKTIKLLQNLVISNNLNSNEILIILKEKLNTNNLEDVELALTGPMEKFILKCEQNCRKKLGKSIVYSRNLLKGHKIVRNDLEVKVSEPFGISAEWIEIFIDGILNQDVKYEDNINEYHFL